MIESSFKMATGCIKYLRNNHILKVDYAVYCIDAAALWPVELGFSKQSSR